MVGNNKNKRIFLLPLSVRWENLRALKAQLSPALYDLRAFLYWGRQGGQSGGNTLMMKLIAEIEVKHLYIITVSLKWDAGPDGQNGAGHFP